MDLRVFTALLLAVIVIGLVVLAFILFGPFLLGMLWAAVLAIVTYKPYEKLVGLLGGRKTLASMVMTVSVLLVILTPFTTLALYFFEDAVQLAVDLKGPTLEARLKNIMNHPTVVRTRDWVADYTGEDFDHRRLAAFLSEDVLPPLLGAFGQALEFLFRLLAALAFVTLSIFFFYRDGPQVVETLRELLPLAAEDRKVILGGVRGAVVAAVRGGFGVALAQGFLGLVILFVLDIQRPILWAGIMALASFIPLVGTSLVWLPLAGLLLLDGQVAKAIALVGYGVLVIAMADNLLRPILVGQHMEAHPLLLFFGTLGGIATFGFAGIILGPVVVALLTVITKLFRREVADATAEAAG